MRRPRAVALLTFVLVLSGCSNAGGLTVTSADFTANGTIPAAFTCAGAGDRPSLSWSGGKASTWAIVVDDPDAPGGDFYHWVVTNLPGGTAGVSGTVPAGATELKNSGGSTGWTPPCPPSGTHHYRFTVYTLKAPLALGADTPPADAAERITKAATAQGRLTGLVTKAG